MISGKWKIIKKHHRRPHKMLNPFLILSAFFCSLVMPKTKRTVTKKEAKEKVSQVLKKPGRIVSRPFLNTVRQHHNTIMHKREKVRDDPAEEKLHNLLIRMFTFESFLHLMRVPFLPIWTFSTWINDYFHWNEFLPHPIDIRRGPLSFHIFEDYMQSLWFNKSQLFCYTSS
jgi:hypothetical protein